ncbi:MAG: type II toxin-antitoxin system VapC family toxin [Acidimicrobiales bacterium]
MILVDTSAWVEFLRDTGSPACEEVDRLLARDLAICDPIQMEVLAGARDDVHQRDLRGLLGRAATLPTEAIDYETAAAFYRTCRRSGETVRKLIDCLIGAVASRHGVPILHADGDIEVLSRHTAVEVHQPEA